MTTRRAPSRIIPRAFPGITPDEVQELISHSKIFNYTPGTVLCREDEVETIFYMILEGEVEVTKVREDKPISELNTRVRLSDTSIVLEGNAICLAMPVK